MTELHALGVRVLANERRVLSVLPNERRVLPDVVTELHALGDLLAADLLGGAPLADVVLLLCPLGPMRGEY